ncbi:MAG: class I SAM-dependent methyltransferase [Devosiaceae bacterium]|nr:class I SAM-dependent methyltransferase [Devosiaceae bacterium MH13]
MSDLAAERSPSTLGAPSLGEFTPLTADNFKDATKALPRTVRRALGIVLGLQYGTLAITLPTGERFRVEGRIAEPVADLHIRSYAFLGNVIRHGDIGVAESFFDGHWTSSDVTRFLELFCHNEQIIHDRMQGNPMARLAMRIKHWMHRNTRKQAKRNIAAHYDLGNAFYERWLDPSMTYSSALYQTGANDLESAQRAKYAALADAAQVQPGDHVLEIGCGWGGFAEYLATEWGAYVTGLTISQEQFDYATERMQRAGLTEQVDIKFQDYRDERGLYDRIVSVEMFEAVGEAYWGTYFETLSKRLKPGGRAGLQIITIQDKFFEHYRKATDFIQQYIFPGGMLPTPTHLKTLGSDAGLSLVDERVFGQDYARTLAEWRQTFLAEWERVAPLGFDERFKRMWLYYLHYCEAGFTAGNIDVRQVVYAQAN